jgi:hypothetical protein
MFKIGTESAGMPRKAAAISWGVFRLVTSPRVLCAALAIALLAGCQGARVGGQSGSEGCTDPESSPFTTKVAAEDAGFADDDGGFDTTSLIPESADQCPAEP